ncbi:Transcription initiation factor TFIID subunit 9 [Monosporozyma unispora]|nr:Transcription initiation factor TFIID subunit 9 [Kazachstania unispora]
MSTDSENIDTSMDRDTPRDVRLLHLLLASQAIHQYEDKVPLQLMDFAYRYTRGVLKDAIMYNEYKENNLVEDKDDESVAETHATAPTANTNTASGGSTTTTNNNSTTTQGQLSVEDIRLAIASRTQYQFKPTAPKELMLKLASDRNKKSLPQVMGSWGVRLPPEKYCITAKEWSINTNNNNNNI